MNWLEKKVSTLQHALALHGNRCSISWRSRVFEVPRSCDVLLSILRGSPFAVSSLLFTRYWAAKGDRTVTFLALSSAAMMMNPLWVPSIECSCARSPTP